ncbi:MAG: IMP dehydrogenase, partial [Desulfohalobiaceae bacterium]
MEKIVEQALTFDDVLLLPDYSEVLPDDVQVQTKLTPEIDLNMPLLSAAMDTVTEARMAISMARAGGIGIVHKNMSSEKQRLEVEKVKKSESGMIVDPLSVDPDFSVGQALEIMSEYRISGLPVVQGDKLVGIVTNRDVIFVQDMQTKVSDVMTSENLVTVPPGTNLEQAKSILHANRIEKLLVVDDHGTLKGLITIKDIDKIKKYPYACKDELGRLRVGAAVGPGPGMLERANALLQAGADLLVLDSAHGHSRNVLQAVRDIRHDFPDCQLVAGNVATYQGARDLLQA